MIHSVTANKASFHPVEFTEGLNLIVAERSQTAGTTDSRNGLGKSTLFQIIDFCLGSDANKDSTLAAELLPEWEFTIDVDIRGRRIKVMRETDNCDVVHVNGNIDGWPVSPESVTDGIANYPVKTWRTILGWAFFNLPMPNDGTEACKTPSARTLINFFIRKQYDDPCLPTKDPSIDELAIAYLLGLNWDYLSRLDTLKKTEKDAKAVKRAADIDLEKWEKTENQLRAECNALESDMKRITEQLEHYNVDPSYAEIEKSVNELTAQIHGLKNRTIRARSRLGTARLQLGHVRASMLPVEELYAECGLVFPDAVKETLENVKRFHDEITGSRHAILEREVRSLEQTIAALDAKVARLSEERSSAMKVLEANHAFDEYNLLIQRYTEKARELQQKQNCLIHLAEAKGQLDNLKEEKAEIGREAKDEYEELRPTWNQSEIFFRTLTQKLYHNPGSLNIQIVANARKYGFKFAPRVENDSSEGIKKIKVFAFDATLFHQQRVCEHPIDFLIHDSKIYDSTDPRQVANALIEADRISRELGGQYICAINSDKLNEEEFKAILPPERSEGFIKLRLSDESDATKLLGISFGRETAVPAAAPVAAAGADAGDGEPPDETASGQQQDAATSDA